jgi:hypothetical protein
MIILNNVTNLTIELSGSVTTNQLPFYCSYRDCAEGELTPSFTSGDTNNTSVINLAPAAASGKTRIIDFFNVFNLDTTAKTVIIKVETRRLFSVVLSPSETLQYTDSQGFQVLTTAGSVKQSINQGSNAADSGFQISVLSLDVTNANVVANTMQDVTGLSFSILNGKLYEFEFNIQYTAALTATGSRWGVNASAGAATNLSLVSEYSLTTTTTTRNALIQAFDSPAATNATSATTGNNWANIKGVIRATADATLIARFASETTLSAIVAKAGSTVKWRRID